MSLDPRSAVRTGPPQSPQEDTDPPDRPEPRSREAARAPGGFYAGFSFLSVPLFTYCPDALSKAASCHLTCHTAHRGRWAWVPVSLPLLTPAPGCVSCTVV